MILTWSIKKFRKKNIHSLNSIKKYIDAIDKLNGFTGMFAGFLTILLVVLVTVDVVNRYFLDISSVAVQELEWHLFAAAFLIGAAYTLREDSHVRVDLFYSKFKPKTQAWINLIGFLLFFLPFCMIIIISSKDFVIMSFNIAEKSPDPGGLPARYILKSVLPLSFLLLIFQGTSLFLKSLLTILNKEQEN